MVWSLFPGSLRGKRRFCVACYGLLLFSSLSLLHIQASPQAQDLEPGKPIERELAGGQSHSYQLALADGQYAMLVVDQRGIDVEVNLFGPDGRQILAVDSEIRLSGREAVPLVAETAGRYRLDVTDKEKHAAAGQYEIRAVEVRVATDNDRNVHQARKLSSEGLRLIDENKYDEARPLIERAMEIREKILGPDHLDIADALHNLAIIWKYKGEYGKAEPLYGRAMEIWEKTLGPDHPN